MSGSSGLKMYVLTTCLKFAIISLKNLIDSSESRVRVTVMARKKCIRNIHKGIFHMRGILLYYF